MKNWKKVLSLTAAVAMTATMMPVSVFAAEDETFKIGVIGPMTGDYAQYGLGVYLQHRLQQKKLMQMVDSTDTM